jgi:hypothetical protein
MEMPHPALRPFSSSPVAALNLEIWYDLLSRLSLRSSDHTDCPQGTLGIPLGNTLKLRYGSSNVWVQGVGGPYGATLAGNFDPRGAPAASIAEGVRLLNLARSKCPNSKVVSGGYS